MSLIGWVIIGILAANVLFLGVMGAVFLLERRDKR